MFAPYNPLPPAYGAVRVPRRHPQIRYCDVCGTTAEFRHWQLVHVPTRRLICCCEACTSALTKWHDGQYRRVPQSIEMLPDFCMTESQWDRLKLPINLGFLYYSSPDRRVLSVYPGAFEAIGGKSPAGLWEELTQQNPILRSFKPDVEGLLVNRVGKTRRYFRVPIDESYQLFSFMRDNWSGVTGGVNLWRQVETCFARWQDNYLSHAAST